MNQTGILTTDAERKNRYVRIVKKRHFAKACKFEYRKRQVFEEIVELEDTQESDTEKWINKLTGMTGIRPERS